MHIDPNEYRFTMSEVIGDSTTDATNLRNWMARDVIMVGQKHKLGRWLFSLKDILVIRVVQNLTSIGGMSPADAHKIAHRVVLRYRELINPDEFGEFPILKKLQIGTPAGRQCLIVTSGRDGPYVRTGTYRADGRIEFERILKDTEELFCQFPTSPFLMVPTDEMIASAVMRHTLDAMEEEGEDWEALNFPALTKHETENPYSAAVSINGLIHFYAKVAAQDAADAQVDVRASSTGNLSGFPPGYVEKVTTSVSRALKGIPDEK